MRDDDATPVPTPVPTPPSRSGQNPNRLAAALHGAGVVGAAVLAAVTAWGLVNLSPPEFAATSMPMTITPQPGDQVRICPGALQRSGLDAANADAIGTVGDVDSRVAVTAGETTRTVLDARVDNDPEPIATTAPPFLVTLPEAASASLAAAETSAMDGQGTSGLVAAGCVEPAQQQWLAAGSTTSGRTNVLSVTNPGTESVHVDFDVFTATGRVRPGLLEAEVPAQGQRSFKLDGIAPDSDALAIRVHTTGGRVAAFLHTARVDGITPSGSDIVMPSPAAAATQIVPGMLVTERPEEPTSVHPDIGTALRLLAPGEDAVHARIAVLDANGTEASSTEVDLDPGRVIDAPIGGVAAGVYTLRVDADAPVVAGGRLQLDGANTDYEWRASSPALGETTLVPVPDGPSPQLVLYNPDTVPHMVHFAGGDGADADENVAPGATMTVDVAPGTDRVVTGTSNLVGALVYRDGSATASMPLLAGNAESRPITVVK